MSCLQPAASTEPGQTAGSEWGKKHEDTESQALLRQQSHSCSLWAWPRAELGQWFHAAVRMLLMSSLVHLSDTARRSLTEHRGRAVYIPNPLPFFGEPLLATHCYTFQQQLAIKFISINAHHSTTFPLLAAVSPMFQYFKPLSSTLCYLSSAHTAKSLCRVSMWLQEEAKQRNTVTKKKGKGKKRTWQEEKLTLEKCQPYTVNLQVGRRNTIKHKEKGSLMTDVCKGLTWGWLKNKQL